MPPSAASDADPPLSARVDASTDDVRLAKRGDLLAFERLYRAHAGRVLALCRRLTGDDLRAEELMQDAFVVAWERLGSFRGESAFATWLHRVTVNAHLVRERGDSRRRARVDELPHGDDEPFASRGDSDPLARIDLERAIATLPPGARTAFVLHDIEGYRHDEIAALSGIAPATVRAQLHRARQLLMERLDR